MFEQLLRDKFGMLPGRIVAVSDNALEGRDIYGIRVGTYSFESNTTRDKCGTLLAMAIYFQV